MGKVRTRTLAAAVLLAGAGAGAGGCSSGGSGGAGQPGGAADAGDAIDGAADGEAGDDAAQAPVDAGPDVDKSAPCVGTFGSALTASFGRLDGTVVAVLPPNDQACPAPNSTHMIIEVMMGGAVYRMVVDVLSTSGSPDVLIDEIDTPLVGPAWADGWHTGITLDYAATFGVHSTAFTPMHQADLVAKITSEIDLGAHITVFGTSGGAAAEPDSAHLIHRQGSGTDGAIVIHPDSATPHWILLNFADYNF